MKKVLIIAALAITTSLTSFGQGYFLFGANSRGVWDAASTPGTSKLAADLDVAFLWAPEGDTPSVDALLTSTPTNGVASFSASTAWSDILSDPNFTLAVNNGTSQTAIVLAGGNGSVNYNSSTQFGVTGTAASTVYSVFLIAWSDAYSTPAAAALADAAVGWSDVFNYTAVSSIGTAQSMDGSGLTPFGVIAVPEPTSMALAGLSGAALLFFRRKKA